MSSAVVEDGLEARRTWFDLRQAMRCEHREKWDAEYRGLMGERVTRTDTPSMSIVVNMVGQGRFTLNLHVADPINPRIDTVCAGNGKLQVITGIPSAQPFPTPAPDGFEPIAHIRVMAGVTSIAAESIEGVHP